MPQPHAGNPVGSLAGTTAATPTRVPCDLIFSQTAPYPFLTNAACGLSLLIVNLPSPTSTLAPGSLLLADPSLRDGIFTKSVILLVDHNANGSMGFILNQPTGKTVSDYLSGEDFAPLARIPVHAGGPVAREHLTFGAMWWNDEGSLAWASRITAEDAIQHSKRPGILVRAFVGYSGWSAGQLEEELERRSWLITQPTRALLSHPHDASLWANTLSPISPFHHLISLCPDEPWLN